MENFICREKDNLFPAPAPVSIIISSSPLRRLIIPAKGKIPLDEGRKLRIFICLYQHSTSDLFVFVFFYFKVISLIPADAGCGKLFFSFATFEVMNIFFRC